MPKLILIANSENFLYSIFAKIENGETVRYFVVDTDTDEPVFGTEYLTTAISYMESADPPTR